MQKFVQETLKEIREIHILLYKLKLIKEKKEKLIKEKKEIELLFKKGLIGDKTFEKMKKEIEEKLENLEEKKHYIITRILYLIDNIDRRIKFLLGTYEIAKEEKIKKQIESTVKQVYKELKGKVPEGPLMQQIREIKEIVPKPQVKIKPVKKLIKKEVEIKKPRLSRVAIRLYQELQRRKIESKRKEKRKILIIHRKERKSSINVFQNISNKYFGNLADFIIKNFPDFYAKFYEVLRRSGIKTLSRTYFALMLFTIFLSILVSLAITTLLCLFFLKFSILNFILTFFLINLLVLPSIIVIFIIYPYIKEKERKENIEAALPFALVQMSAIASANVSPYTMIKVIANTDEFKDLSDEFKRIVEYVDYMGYDLTTALNLVAEETPSYKLKDFLKGMVSIIKSGGNLSEYIKEKALDALAHYRTERKKFIQALQTYSDLYTGIVVAAPLFFIATLAVLQTLGGKVFNIDISKIIFFGTYILIPMINIAFLLFIHYTQPKG